MSIPTPLIAPIELDPVTERSLSLLPAVVREAASGGGGGGGDGTFGDVRRNYNDFAALAAAYATFGALKEST